MFSYRSSNHDVHLSLHTCCRVPVHINFLHRTLVINAHSCTHGVMAGVRNCFDASKINPQVNLYYMYNQVSLLLFVLWSRNQFCTQSAL